MGCLAWHFVRSENNSLEIENIKNQIFDENDYNHNMLKYNLWMRGKALNIPSQEKNLVT